MNKITLEDHNDFLVWRAAGARHVEIYDIVVTSERRQGKGRKLIELLLKSFRHGSAGMTLVYAVTRWGNTIAQQFYEALGFRIIGRLHNFYCDGPGQYEHGVMYGLDL